ncbi:uncharacterized protein LOC114526810 [Dendronephthya gigantea]|uniref:uncharacterized protein LOC114526810 n=1 Tax=Dendronephthya gigantea TaxID=151771 RepID=UPI001068E0D6|nr:uncharacterized protein LOC114526810 [Dendronephthya gigantea]
MYLSFTLFLVLLASVANAEVASECNSAAVIKTWQTQSLCARREKMGVLIGYGYNINLPHVYGDFAVLGIDPTDIRKKVIMQGPSECDCTQSFCLTSEQSERLFQINIDRAHKQISSILRSSPGPMPCCDIQNSLTALAFTFGIDFLKDIPDGLSHINNGHWQKLGAGLSTRRWCTVTDHCSPLAQRIMNGCANVTDNLGCAPPTPQSCDSAGRYCCAANNTCCSVSQSRRNQAYWCCPLAGAACCSSSNSCCPKKYPVCCGNTNSCCFVDFPVCCFPGTSQAYCCAASSPVCLGEQHCGSLDPNIRPVLGKVNRANQPPQLEIVH